MVAGVARAALAVSLIAMGAALTAPPPLRSTSARTTASVAPRRAGVTPVDEDLDFAAFTPPPVKDGDWVDAFCRATNGAMRDAVALTTPGLVRAIAVRSATDLTGGGDGPNRVLGRFPFATAKLTTPPEWPGVPRPVSLTVLASVPTALGWYGYYKFSFEQELFEDELRRSGRATGCGGYGTLFPFVYAVLLGGLLQLVPGTALDDAGGALWSLAGVWILGGQLNLYRRVNELFDERGEPPPVHAWWALLPPPLDVVVGLRQVHFLAKYWADVRGEQWEADPIAEELFPFIASERFTLEQFVREPRRWFWFTGEWDDWF